MNLIGTMSEDLVLKGVTDSPCSIAERRDYYSHFMYVEIRFRSYTSDPKECKNFMVLQFWEASIIIIFFFPTQLGPLISEANSDVGDGLYLPEAVLYKKQKDLQSFSGVFHCLIEDLSTFKQPPFVCVRFCLLVCFCLFSKAAVEWHFFLHILQTTYVFMKT